MIEQMIYESRKGFFHALAVVFFDIIFWRVCYCIGWPLCKLFTLGSYPKRKPRERAIFREQPLHTGFTCSAVGLLAVLSLALHYSGSLPPDLYLLITQW